LPTSGLRPSDLSDRSGQPASVCEQDPASIFSENLQVFSSKDNPPAYLACFLSRLACFFSLRDLVDFFLDSFLVSLDFPNGILFSANDLK
jgi:hypothetical protein